MDVIQEVKKLYRCILEGYNLVTRFIRLRSSSNNTNGTVRRPDHDAELAVSFQAQDTLFIDRPLIVVYYSRAIPAGMPSVRCSVAVSLRYLG